MDNNTSPTNGLDLNPDMMTTQTGVPSVAAPASSAPPEPAGVIDITPGAPSSPLPQSKVEHLTPTPAADGLTHLADIAPQTEPTPSPVFPSSSTPVMPDAKSPGVIDITPGPPTSPVPNIPSPTNTTTQPLPPTIPQAAA